MNALIWLIPIALALGLTGLMAFFWSMRTGQFDDPKGDASRILQSEDRPIVDDE
ncbi:MAG: cbb3-type cytochrome oxidase assembly protein CcoS [Alphaproteobacteria bacterium]